MLNRFLYLSEIVFAAEGSTDWIGCRSEHGHTSWIALDWVRAGFDLAKWTQVSSVTWPRVGHCQCPTLGHVTDNVTHWRRSH